MTSENETVADIIAEKRLRAAEMEKTLGDQHSFVESLKDDADRLEAAHRREKDALQAQVDELRLGIEQYRQYNAEVVKECNDKLGNAAKLREALKATLDLFWDIHNANRSPQSNQAYAVIGQIKAALAAPPRNCDKFANAVEAMAELKRVHSYCAKENRRCLEDCPDCGKEWCSLAWLFAPATESEAAR